VLLPFFAQLVFIGPDHPKEDEAAPNVRNISHINNSHRSHYDPS